MGDDCELKKKTFSFGFRKFLILLDAKSSVYPLEARPKFIPVYLS